MKILVPIKRVPDYDSKIVIDSSGKGYETKDIKWIMNPFDEIAVEEALRLQEKHGGEVVICSVGGPEVEKEIRHGLAMGADRGILIESQDADSFAVANYLTKIWQDEKFDLLICGKQAVDSDRNQMGQIFASLLDLPIATFASEVLIEGGNVKVTREIDGGLLTVSFALPGVITCDLRLNEPRYASLPGIMKAKKKEIKTVTPEQKFDPKIKLIKYIEPQKKQQGIFVESVDELLSKLKERKVI